MLFTLAIKVPFNFIPPPTLLWIRIPVPVSLTPSAPGTEKHNAFLWACRKGVIEFLAPVWCLIKLSPLGNKHVPRFQSPSNPRSFNFIRPGTQVHCPGSCHHLSSLFESNPPDRFEMVCRAMCWVCTFKEGVRVSDLVDRFHFSIPGGMTEESLDNVDSDFSPFISPVSLTGCCCCVWRKSPKLNKNQWDVDAILSTEF